MDLSKLSTLKDEPPSNPRNGDDGREESNFLFNDQKRDDQFKQTMHDGVILFVKIALCMGILIFVV